MNFATKLSKIIYKGGKERDVMKMPKTDSGKSSFPGELAVVRDENGYPIILPLESLSVNVSPKSGRRENLLETVYDNGVVCKWDSFDELKQRLEKEWNSSPLIHDPISQELKEKSKKIRKEQQILNAASITGTNPSV